MFSQHMPAVIVGRQQGCTHVFPLTSLMCEWTKGEWPYEGSSVHAWDFQYMTECMKMWSAVAY